MMSFRILELKTPSKKIFCCSWVLGIQTDWCWVRVTTIYDLVTLLGLVDEMFAMLDKT